MPTLESDRKPWIPKPKKRQNKAWSHDPRYHTQRWRKYRISFLKSNPLCVECNKVDKKVPAKVVGHIIPVLKQPDLFWEATNHKALCVRCNNRQAVTDRKIWE